MERYRGIESGCARGGRRPGSGAAHLAGDGRRDTIRSETPRDARGACRAPGRGDGAVPFWDEVAAEEETSAVTIYWHESSLTRGRPVRRAETGTVQGLHFTTNAGEPLVAAMQMLAELCLGFACARRAFEDVLPRRSPSRPWTTPPQGAIRPRLRQEGFSRARRCAARRFASPRAGGS